MPPRVELLTPAVAIERGSSGTAMVQVRNDGDAAEAFEVTVTGEAAAWATPASTSVSVPGGGAEDVEIVFAVPPDASGGFGGTPFSVRAWSASGASGADVAGVIEVVSPVELDPHLGPARSRGARGADVRLRINNRGAAPTRVLVSASAPDADIDVRPESLVVDAGVAELVRLHVRSRTASGLWRSRTIPYTVTIEPLDSLAVTLTGTAIQRSRAMSGLPWLVSLLLAAGLTAGVLAAGLSGTARDESTGVTTGTGRRASPGTTAAGAPTTTPVVTSTMPPPATTTAPQPIPIEDRRVAFQTRRDGNFEIYSMSPTGGTPANITNHPAHDGEPAWSPDGRRIAFDSDRDGAAGEFDIYTMDADGQNVVRLTHEPGPDGYPSWSPDGTRLAFISFRNGNSEIYTMSTDGTDLQQLTRNPADDGHPTWSPDGQTIVFQSNRSGNYEIYAMRPDGTEVRPLTDSPGSDTTPSLSPDGKRIVFASTRHGDQEIYVMPAAGGSATRLTESAGHDLWPTFSASGEEIAFVSNRDGDDEIYVMPAAGGPARRLTTSPGPDSEPAW